MGVIDKFCWDVHDGYALHCFDHCGVQQCSFTGFGWCGGHGVFCIVHGIVGAGWDIVAGSGLGYAGFSCGVGI